MPIQQHFTILKVIYIISGGLALLAALGVATMLTGIGAASAGIEGFMVLSGIGVFVAAFLAILAAPSLLLAYGLHHRRPWARILGLVLGALNLLAFPLGTLIGVYTIFILVKPEAELELSGRGALAV
jgi:hypothetical protein